MAVPKVSIIILTYNNLDYTRQCLESIFQKTEDVRYEIILVDNNSADGTRVYLKNLASEHTNLQVILNTNNEGFARGNNQGAAAAEGEYLVFLNNDVVVTRGWLRGLLRHLDDPNVGLVGPVTNSSGNETRIRSDYQNIEDMEAFAESHTRAHRDKSFEISMLAFLCVAMRRAVFDEIGPLDERFGLGMFEDDDYAMRLRQKGYKILCAEDVFVHHYGSASFSRLETKQYWRLFSTNLEKYEEKWGVRWQPHLNRAELMPEQVRQMVDSSLFFTQVISERDQTIHELQALIDRLTVEVNELGTAKYELQMVYASDGWAFLQALLRARRAMIPEGSQREQVFVALLQALRQRKIPRLPAVRIRNRKQPPLPSLPALVGKAASLDNRFPWPLVSVILPVFNHADLLPGAAHSALFSDYPNLELIILDDGSTDDIEPVLTRLFSNPRLSVFRQPNQKLPRALTHAHSLTRGQFITWTSSDNYLAPGAISALVNGLLAHPEAVLAYADVALIDEHGKLASDGSYRPQNIDPARETVVRLHREALPLGHEVDNYINACFLYRRECAQSLEGHYADDLRGLEDYDFWLRMQKAGCFVHLGNDDPLYFYRVHSRSMSHVLLSQELNTHLKRGQELIQYEEKRRMYTRQRWNLVLDSSLVEAERAKITQAAAPLPVELSLGDSGWDPSHKKLRFAPWELDLDDTIYVKNLPDAWRLIWQSPWTGETKVSDFWHGCEVPPLALKARDLRKNNWEFPQARGRPVIGLHTRLDEYPFDIPLLRQVIAGNPWAFFVFAAEPGADQASIGMQLITGLENAAYAGERLFGEVYPLYACFDVFWLPPFTAPPPEGLYRKLLCLAYAAGRPLIAPRQHSFIPAPYQWYYQPPGESLTFIQSIERKNLDRGLMDRYLALWSPAGSIKQLLRHADTITQEMALPRPDFGISPPPEATPQAWRPVHQPKQTHPKCAIVVDTLDKGGLEEMVAQIARRLPEHGIETFLLCAQSGGMVADRLKKEGIRLYIADGHPANMLAVLRKEAPQVVNTQWAGLPFLQAAAECGIPVIETIQNTYVWLNATAWEAEKQRSRHFSHATATSELAKDYYLKWNNAYNREWITVIPNGIDPQRVILTDYSQARLQLGLPDSAFVFLSLASYDGRKNQLGLLTAFEAAARLDPDLHLICAGNVADDKYYQEVRAYHRSLSSRERLHLYEFRQDTSLLLSAADGFVVDSFFEGWSLAASEALMAGLPLIHSECGSAAELVGANGERGCQVPNPACPSLDLTWELAQAAMDQKQQANTPALIQALLQMAAEREKWRSQRHELRAFALEHLGIDHILHQYRKTIESVIYR